MKTKVKKYYQKPGSRIFWLLYPFAFLPLLFSIFQREHSIYTLIMLAILFAVLGAVSFNRFFSPEVVISESGMAIRPGLFGIRARWDEIETVLIESKRTLLTEMEILRIVPMDKKLPRAKNTVASLSSIENSSDLIQVLEESGRLSTKDISIRELAEEKAPKSERLTYQGWKLDSQGLHGEGQTVSWENVLHIQHADVVYGFGNLTLTYKTDHGRQKQIRFTPQLKKEYQEFAAYLITHAPSASLSQNLLRFLQMSPEKADKENLVFLLLTIALIGGAIILPIAIHSFIVR